jgi:hypothetical protein
MNTSSPLRSAQSLTAALTSFLASTPLLRAALLSGLAILGSAGAALAQQAPSVQFKQANTRLCLTIENPAQQQLQMQVISLTERNCLVNEKNSLPSYGTQLNFKGVPAGQYAVLLRVGRERYRYNVQVQSQPETSILIRELAPAADPKMVAATTR